MVLSSCPLRPQAAQPCDMGMRLLLVHITVLPLLLLMLLFAFIKTWCQKFFYSLTTLP